MSAPKMVEVPAADAILNAASDAFPFLLEPETFPVFYEWMRKRGRVQSNYTAEMMHQDLVTINGRLQAAMP